MRNATLTLSIPIEMKREMQKFKGINWSEETRLFLNKKLENIKITKKVERALEQNEYNKTAINELLQKLIREKKLNLSDDFSDLNKLKEESLKEIWDNESDEVWKEYLKKYPNKKKLY